MGGEPIAIFTYGTLEVPEVMEAVTGQRFSSQHASAKGFGRYLLDGRVYPGMTEEAGATTHGRVYFDIHERALLCVDAFEDELYTRTLIEIHTTCKDSFTAFAYLIPPELRDCLSLQPWNKDEFIRRHLQTYLESCRAFYLETSRNIEQ